MKLTERELKVFGELNKSETGKVLCEYLERVKLEIGFLPENVEAAKLAIKMIDEKVLSMVKLQNDKKENNPNQYVE